MPSAYIGLDPSASSLQVGNLMALLLLRRAQLCGVRPVILFGGATGLIGDPAGKKQERVLLDKNIVLKNLESMKKQVALLIDCDKGSYKAKFVNNYDWFHNLGYIDFLRTIGKHITINYMLAKDSVKLRMDTGISYAEFGYMLIQGYDFLYLYKEENCFLQLGGSDQWGNMTIGIELIRRRYRAEAHAISAPLLTDGAGNKLGKTEDGAIFLDPSLTSPYQFYQYWIQQADADVLKLLRSLTLLDDTSLAELEASKNPEERLAQKTLAQELTSMVHGKDAALSAKSAAKVLFSKNPDALNSLDVRGLEFLSREVPSSEFHARENVSLLDLLVRTGLAKSKGEARRSILGNGVSINRIKIQDEKYSITKEEFKKYPFLLLGVGKTKLHLVLMKK